GRCRRWTAVRRRGRRARGRGRPGRSCRTRTTGPGARAGDQRTSWEWEREEPAIIRPGAAAPAADDAVVAKLAARGGAVDAQHGRGAALVALAVVQHFHEQGNLQLAQGDAVEILRIAAVEVADVAAHGGGHVIAQRRPRRAAGMRLVGVGSVQSDPGCLAREARDRDRVYRAGATPATAGPLSGSRR